MQPTFEATYRGELTRFCLRTDRYDYGQRLAVILNSCDDRGQEQESCFAMLSVNVTEFPLASGEFIADHDLARDFLAELETRGLIKQTGKTADYGYVRGSPVCRLTDRARALDRSKHREAK